MYLSLYIYIYIIITNDCHAGRRGGRQAGGMASQHLVADKWGRSQWGRCKSKDFCRIGKKVHPGILGNIDLTGVPKSSSVKKPNVCSDPIRVDPICPFPKHVGRRAGGRGRGRRAYYVCICMCLYIYIYIYMHINLSLSLSLSLIYIYIHTHTYGPSSTQQAGRPPAA